MTQILNSLLKQKSPWSLWVNVLAWEMPLDRSRASSTLCFLLRVALLCMPAGLLVNKPCITSPDDQVQEAKHLQKTENKNDATNVKKKKGKKTGMKNGHLLTTDISSERMLENSVTSHVKLCVFVRLVLMPSVLVAYLTFFRPCAQADEHTSQRKANAAVTKKS